MSAASDLLAHLVDHDFAAADALLRRDVSINAIASRGRPVVQWAFDRGDRAIVDWVLDQHPDLQAPGLMAQLLQKTQPFRDPVLLHRLLLIGGPEALNAVEPITGRTPLMHALQMNPFDLGWCRALIKNGANVNACGALGGDSILMVALNEGRHALIKDLAEAGADPNVPNAVGQVAAHAAVSAMDDRGLMAFLEYFPGADLDRPATSGTPPIMLHGSPKAVAAMLNAGASANVRSANRLIERQTLLMYLLETQAATDVIELALSKGADPSLEDDQGRTVASYAVHAQRLDLLPLFYDHGLSFKEPLDRQGSSPYHALLDMGFSDAVIAATSLLGRVPVDIGVRPGPLPLGSECLPSPLFTALSRGLGEHAQLLVESGAKVDALGSDGVPSFHGLVNWAHHMSQETTTYQRRLAAIGAVAGADDKRAASLAKLTEEYLASQTKFAQQVDGLIALAPQWDLPDPQGDTLLHRLVALDQPELAAKLAAAGASPLIPDREGWTALDQAVRQGQVATLHAWRTTLAAQGTPWVPDLAQWVLNSPEAADERPGFCRALESLIKDPQWNTWVNTPAADGNTPLILAVATGQSDLVSLFLAHGAKATLTNDLGETALHHAVAEGNLESVEHLVAAGADPYTPTQHNEEGGVGLSAWDLAHGDAAIRQVLDKPNPRPASWTPTEGLQEDVARGEQWSQKNPSPVVRRRRQP